MSENKLTQESPAQAYGKHEGFIVHQESPFNGGSPAHILRQSHLTPEDAFYVRAHAPVPDLAPEAYRLLVNGRVNTPLTLTLDELRQNFPKQTVTATLQCAGNRRQEMAKVAPMPGESVMWGTEAISNAVWGGVSLADVLNAAGVADDSADGLHVAGDGLHVAFQSYDQVEKAGETFGYGGSIPLEKALRPEVLLAYEMNGEALPQVHGAPLRVVVPGYVAARSVKWVGTITVQDEPSQNFYQQRDYKVFPPDIHEDNVDWAQGEMLGLMRTDAVICVPPEGAAVSPGDLLVQGYAIGGGDSLITRVELSTDDGATWQDAEIVSEVQRWAWCFWQATVRLSPGDHALRVRVHDDQGSVQATSAAALWNFKGYMNNSQHRVCVKVTAG